jgi:hypothetical protein
LLAFMQYILQMHILVMEVFVDSIILSRKY